MSSTCTAAPAAVAPETEDMEEMGALGAAGLRKEVAVTPVWAALLREVVRV